MAATVSTAAEAQPTLNGMTLFRTNAAGNANINGGPVFAAWRTSDGINGQNIAEFFVRNRADGDNTGLFASNTGPNLLQLPLVAGANTFWFYASGDDARNLGGSWGLNMSFGTGPASSNAAPSISAVTSLGGGFAAIGAGQQTVLGDGNFGAGAGTLSFTGAPWTAVLSNFQILSDVRSGSTIDRVGFFAPTSGDGMDNYGTFTLTVSNANTVVPEPTTWLLMLTGLGGIGVTVSRRRGAARPA